MKYILIHMCVVTNTCIDVGIYKYKVPLFHMQNRLIMVTILEEQWVYIFIGAFTILACLNTEGQGGWSWSHSNSFNHKFVCVVRVEWTECVLCVDRGVLELSSCVHFCDIDDVHSNQSILMMKWWWTPLDENAFRAKSIPTSILWPGRRRCRQETSNYICSWLSNKVGELKV